MFRKVYLLTAVLTFLIFSFCSKDNNPVGTETPEPGLPRELSNAEIKLISSSENFGLKLFKEIVSQDENKNIFISPLSVSMALGMTLNGANGQTETDMQNTLEFTDLTQDEINSAYKSLIELFLTLDNQVIMELANSIWYRTGFEIVPDFVNVNQTYFDAEVAELDFSSPDALSTINDWAENKTHGKIKDLIDQMHPNAVMYLLNAIYFKGTWKYEFDPEYTADDNFTLEDGSQVTCSMMNMEGKLQYMENDLFQAVDLPYGVGNYYMTVFLPKSGKTTEDIISQFNSSNWDSWTGSFAEDDVILGLPKFKIEYYIEQVMKDALNVLGMGIAFDPVLADFTGMRLSGGLWINRVIHKTFVEVNEEGTEAAAATAVEMIERAGPSGQYMKVNKPFIFTIRENCSGTILFIGKIINPEI